MILPVFKTRLTPQRYVFSIACDRWPGFKLHILGRFVTFRSMSVFNLFSTPLLKLERSAVLPKMQNEHSTNRRQTRHDVLSERETGDTLAPHAS